MEMIIFYEYSPTEYGKALAHICFNNEQMSFTIA